MSNVKVVDMYWVPFFVGLALAGLAVLVGCGVRVVRRASRLLAELNVLGERLAEGTNLLGQLGRLPALASAPDRGAPPDLGAYDGDSSDADRIRIEES